MNWKKNLKNHKWVNDGLMIIFILLMNKMSFESYDYLIKCILVGDASVGKTSLCQDLCEQRFSSTYEQTIGIDFYSKVLKLQPNDTGDVCFVKLQLWDTAGMERFKPITQSYYRGVTIAFVVYDATRRETFAHVNDWLNDVRRLCDNSVLLILIHNKSDLYQQTQVDVQTGRDFAEKNDMLFFETSAKNNIGVEICFKQAARKMIERMGWGLITPSYKRLDVLNLEPPSSKPFSREDWKCNCQIL
jgi:small GTP-binding protein